MGLRMKIKSALSKVTHSGNSSHSVDASEPEKQAAPRERIVDEHPPQLPPTHRQDPSDSTSSSYFSTESESEYSEASHNAETPRMLQTPRPTAQEQKSNLTERLERKGDLNRERASGSAICSQASSDCYSTPTASDAGSECNGKYETEKTTQLKPVTHEHIRHVEVEEVTRVHAIDRHVHHVVHHIQPIADDDDVEVVEPSAELRALEGHIGHNKDVVYNRSDQLHDHMVCNASGIQTEGLDVEQIADIQSQAAAPPAEQQTTPKPHCTCSASPCPGCSVNAKRDSSIPVPNNEKRRSEPVSSPRMEGSPPSKISVLGGTATSSSKRESQLSDAEKVLRKLGGNASR